MEHLCSSEVEAIKVLSPGGLVGGVVGALTVGEATVAGGRGEGGEEEEERR